MTQYRISNGEIGRILWKMEPYALVGRMSAVGETSPDRLRAWAHLLRWQSPDYPSNDRIISELWLIGHGYNTERGTDAGKA